MMITQEERRTATQKQILNAAKALFVAHRYDATSTDMILAAAQVSRGAMYHHYAGKEEVFAAVFEQASQEAIALMLARIDQKSSPLEQLVQGSIAWLRVVRRADLAAILLEQGPQALGWIRARDLENQYSLGIMRGSLKAAMAAGQIHVES
ncbi:MAG: helix-turn-helix domain containing protein, partial [Proteobacteria bacterium]|nr:helix-turn-helix domain containing protein [Pseudomonadota bacterium]